MPDVQVGELLEVVNYPEGGEKLIGIVLLCMSYSPNARYPVEAIHEGSYEPFLLSEVRALK